MNISEDFADTLANAVIDQTQALDAVYAERNQCVALIARMAQIDGFRVGLLTSSDFEPGWQKCIVIDLPTGQVTWHLKDSELPLFDFPDYQGVWDGHTTEEKYKRVNDAFQISHMQVSEITINVKKIMSDADLRIDLAALATEMLSNTPDDGLSAEHLALKRRLQAKQHLDQAPASQPYETITDTQNATATYSATPAEASDPMLHSSHQVATGRLVFDHGASQLNVMFDHSIPEE